MRLPENSEPYLTGKVFSNAFTLPIDFHAVIPKRVSYLCEIAKGKRIVHLGCLDHKELIDDKVNAKQWLHKELTEVSSACIGIDINTETLNYVKEKYGIDNILIADMMKTSIPEISNHQWDYAILGELLEHISNPTAFLKSIRDSYEGCIDKIIITVPNAFTQSNFRNSNKNKEVINSDHKFWFTPYTLASVMSASGIIPVEFYFVNRIPLTTTELVMKKVLNMVGMETRYNFTYASSIVAIGKLSGNK
jgi:hypothetical protein